LAFFAAMLWPRRTMRERCGRLPISKTWRPRSANV